MTTGATWPLEPDDVPALWHEAQWDIDEDVLLETPPPIGGLRVPLRPMHERLVDAHGGIVSARELVGAGIPEEHIRILRDHGTLRRIRKGWYCLPALGELHVLAWRIGGPLACVSALVHHGLLGPGDVHSDDGLHVARREHSSRRLSDLSVQAHAETLGIADGGRPPTLHWCTRDFRSGTRLAVSVETALEQARHCRPLLAARARARAEDEQPRPSGSAPPSASR